LKRGLEKPWDFFRGVKNERNHVCGVSFLKIRSFLREFLLKCVGGILWNRRYGRLLEVMEEELLADNAKGSWTLHVLSRQFGEMNLQRRVICVCGLCKGDFARTGITEK
jgi:hypothetical protein